MSDYLSRIVAKNLNSARLIQPRLKLRFEPPSLSGEMMHGSDSFGGRIVSSSMKSEADSPITGSPNLSLEISKEIPLALPMSESVLPHSRNYAERAELLTQIDQSLPVSRISDHQTQSSPDGMPAPSVPVRAVKRTEHESQIDQSHPVSRISDQQTQSSSDGMPAPSCPVRANIPVKRTEHEAQIDQSHPVSWISDIQIHPSPDGLPASSASVFADRSVKRTEQEIQIDQSHPVSRISDIQIHPSPDGLPASSVSAFADRSVKRTEQGIQIGLSHPISRISDQQKQSSPDGMPASSVSAFADRSVKRNKHEAQINKSHPISQISYPQTQLSPDALPSSLFPGRADSVVKRAELKTQNNQSISIGRGSDRQIQSSPDAMTILPVPAIMIKPEEGGIMGKQGYLEVADSAEHRSHKNSLRLSDENDGLMQSLASDQKARLSISTKSQTIIAPQKEIWFMDQRKDEFLEKSPPRFSSSIKVNIGRIEVRAAAPTQAPPPPKKAVSTSRSGLSLDDYLKRRR